ncbi:MAG: thrombospondin type 3 repeat-containing protein [Kiritimatiellia bacterium]
MISYLKSQLLCHANFLEGISLMNVRLGFISVICFFSFTFSVLAFVDVELDTDGDGFPDYIEDNVGSNKLIPDYIWFKARVTGVPYNQWYVRWIEHDAIVVASTIDGGLAQPNPETHVCRVGSTNTFGLQWRFGHQATNAYPYPIFPDSAHYSVSFELVYCPKDVALIFTQSSYSFEGDLPYEGPYSPPLNNAFLRFYSKPRANLTVAEKEAVYGDPINIVSRSTYFRESDLNIPCPSFDLSFNRFYNNKMYKVGGALGDGWTHSLNWRLLTYTGMTYRSVSAPIWKVLSPGNDEMHWFAYSGSNWTSPFDKNWNLIDFAEGSQLSFSNGTIYRFNTNGFLTSITNVAGRNLCFSYTGNGSTQLVSRVEHDNGQYMDLYYSNGLLVGVTTPVSNYFMQFSYNSSSNLIEAIRSTSDGESSITYLYDPLYATLTQHVNRVGDIFNYSYSFYTNSYGMIESQATGVGIGTNNYFQTQMIYDENSLPSHSLRKLVLDVFCKTCHSTGYEKQQNTSSRAFIHYSETGLQFNSGAPRPAAS